MYNLGMQLAPLLSWHGSRSSLAQASPCSCSASVIAFLQITHLRSSTPAVIMEPLGRSQQRQRRDCSVAAGPNRDRPGGQGQRDTQ
eukprot:scaffold114446_cov15-Tisochrysis_lutea.AAC.1